MCMSTPKAPPPPPPPKQPPTPVDASVSRAGDREKRRQQAQGGYGSTIMTGPMGVSAPANIGKTLLGA